MLWWVALVASMMVLAGALMNAASVIAKERPGDLANNPYGWAGSKFWRAGVVILVAVLVAGGALAIFD